MNAPKKSQDERRIAMLVDGENIAGSHLEWMFAQASQQGDVIIRRVYGDWTSGHMSGWKQPLQSLGFQPVQQFRNVGGKNAADCALIVDAMDILYARLVDGFCLASSDSDFTRLAIRLRENGCFVMGIGATITPQPLVAACQIFKTLPQQPITTNKPVRTPTENGALLLLQEFFAAHVPAGEWISLTTLGSQIRKTQPDFTPKKFGHSQLGKLIAAYPEEFVLKECGSNKFARRVDQGVAELEDALIAGEAVRSDRPIVSPLDTLFADPDEDASQFNYTYGTDDCDEIPF